MAKRKGPKLELPEKRHFAVAELAEILARCDGDRADRIRWRLYRQIQRGAIRTRRYLGVLVIPYEEARRVAAGEEVW